MADNRGIIVARSDQDVDSDVVDFDSRRSHLQIDLARNPKHFDILTLHPTALSVDDINMYREETLLSILHGLKVTPRVLTYFYAVSAPGGAPFATAGSYFKNWFPMVASGAYQDVIIYTITSTTFTVKHTIEKFIVDGTTRTSIADQYNIQLKYEILSNEGSSDVTVFDP